MHYFPLLRNVLTLAFAVASLQAQAQVQPNVPSRPNVVLIIADDMAADDFGAAGNQGIQTPNLDRFAASGMRFRKAMLTCSSCSPSRSSIITCRYPHNTDAEQLHWPLPKGQVTFVEQLKKAGYYTAASGKWHLGNPVKDRFDLVDEAGTSAFQLPAEGSAATKNSPALVDNKNASGCANWLRVLQERPKDKPFFLWLAAFDPHRDYEANVIAKPHRPEQVSVPPFLPDTLEVRKDLALYYDEITRLDQYVGAVLDELDRQQVASNTMVIFLSDNGRPFPRCKTTIYDSGVRTPLMIKWPAQVPQGVATDALVSSIDLGATILEACHVPTQPEFMGQSFIPVLRDPKETHRSYAFSEHNWHDYDALKRGVRSARYRYIKNYLTDYPQTPPADAVRSPTFQAMLALRDQSKLNAVQANLFSTPRPAEEFYDLENDPFELVNLIDRPELQTRIAEHRDALTKWQAETNDTELLRAADEFDRETGKPLPNRARPRPTKDGLRSAKSRK